ncbi:DUF6587 family protein [Piscinibacter sp. XHJ-5]|uniref:DUF6587 family protein n=1 Tax=Piscinibacter sp. XHJ-5 TaxID=3037797 RepID=UPI002452C111|nr:DUF6587 family protein [Piscinibacter sp. XHJ-5]
MQAFIVALIVIGCTAYAVWTLMPSAARRALAQLLLRVRWPDRIARVWRREAASTGGCGGCDSCGDAVPRDSHTIKVHRRLPR